MSCLAHPQQLFQLLNMKRPANKTCSWGNFVYRQTCVFTVLLIGSEKREKNNGREVCAETNHAAIFSQSGRFRKWERYGKVTERLLALSSKEGRKKFLPLRQWAVAMAFSKSMALRFYMRVALFFPVPLYASIFWTDSRSTLHAELGIRCHDPRNGRTTVVENFLTVSVCHWWGIETAHWCLLAATHVHFLKSSQRVRRYHPFHVSTMTNWSKQETSTSNTIADCKNRLSWIGVYACSPKGFHQRCIKKPADVIAENATEVPCWWLWVWPRWWRFLSTLYGWGVVWCWVSKRVKFWAHKSKMIKGWSSTNY